MKVVLDTNTLIACFARKSQYRPIYSSLLEGKYQLAVSNDILSEYAEIIERQTGNSAVSHNVLELLVILPNVEKQKIYYNWNLITHDPDDNKFVDCYIAAGAEYLVSNDHHFDVLSPDDFPPVRVVSVEAFLEIIQNV